MKYTQADFDQFDRLTWEASSPRQLNRINARLALSKMEKRLGKETLGEMWEEIQRRDTKTPQAD
jgi:hypothetical protein